MCATLLLAACDVNVSHGLPSAQSGDTKAYDQMNEEERFAVYKESIDAIDSADSEASQYFDRSGPLSQSLVDALSKKADELYAKRNAQIREKYQMSQEQENQLLDEAKAKGWPKKVYDQQVDQFRHRGNARE